MDWFTIVQLAMTYGPTIVSIVRSATSNEEIATKITELAPEVGQLVADLGSQLFPKSSSALHQVGGAIAAFDIDTTKWVQKACNSLNNAGLDVDGRYGPKTRAAVEALQTKYGLVVDGLAGKVTQAAIQIALSKLG